MPLLLDDLISAAPRFRQQIAESVDDARRKGFKTAFLCHSHKDAALVNGIAALLRETGWNVYVDWMDAEMPSAPNIETAKKIKQKIQQANRFIFLATPNSTASRWCPWEIGYADGVKSLDDIFIVPTRDRSEITMATSTCNCTAALTLPIKVSWARGDQVNEAAYSWEAFSWCCKNGRFRPGQKRMGFVRGDRRALSGST